MPRRVGIKRKVIAYITSTKRTRRGNPDHFLFLLECGHVRRQYYGADALIATFGVAKQLGWTMGCFDCKEGKKPSKYWLNKFPYRLFKENPELEKIYQSAENDDENVRLP